MRLAVRVGLLAAIYVSAVLTVTTLSHLPALAMSFASSAILLAAQPDTAAAQPQALIGGHMIAALCGWTVGSLVGDGVAGAAIAIGAAALLMQVTRTLHPPAAVSGYLMLHQPGHWTWLVFPILCGAILLSVLASVARRLVPSPAQTLAGSATFP
jgi:CBS-domain-containing membrane protein